MEFSSEDLAVLQNELDTLDERWIDPADTWIVPLPTKAAVIEYIQNRFREAAVRDNIGKAYVCRHDGNFYVEFCETEQGE